MRFLFSFTAVSKSMVKVCYFNYCYNHVYQELNDFFYSGFFLIVQLTREAVQGEKLRLQDLVSVLLPRERPQ